MPVKPELATPAWSRRIVLSVFIAVFCCVSVSVSAQDGYYFPSQNRFVPSSGSIPRQQQTLNGFRSGNSGGYSPAPGSYQEQLLFIANENNSNNNNKQQAAIAANSPYGTPFGAGSQQFAKPNRQSEYYDISPRPFGVPVVGGGATSVVSAAPPSGLIRSKAIRNGASLGSSLNSFQPQSSQSSAQTQRVNVPHQQTQFLAHFSENEKRLPSTSNSAALRPFGNGGFSPSLTRTRTHAPPPAVVEDATPQAASPYRLRNRFQPATSAPASSSTPSTTSSAEVSSKRYNRFGSNRATAKTTSTTSSTTSAPSSERPSFGRKPPNPRRPVFISREVNEPVSVVSKRPFSFNNSGRLKLPLRPTSSTTSTTEGLEAEDSNEQYEQESHEEEEEEEEQPLQQQLLDHQLEQKQVEPASLEKLPLQEQTSSPIAISQESSSPEYSTSSTEESQTDASDSSDFTEETTLSNPSHEYEYVEEHDDKATTTAMPASKEEKDSTEDQERQTELETETTELPSESTSTTSNAPEDAAENSQQTTAEASEESSKSSTSKQEEESEYDDEEGEEGDEEYEYDEEEELEDGAGGEEAHEEAHSDANVTTESESLQEATHSRETEVEHENEREIISVVTTKSIVNGSTAYPVPPVTPSSFSSTTIADSQPSPQTEEHTEPTSRDVIETTPLPGDDLTSGTPNVTESYVVVASIQTSRSINGARFLPFPAIEQEETKQTLSELERKVHSKQQHKQPELSESSEEPTTTTSSTTTTTTTTEAPSSIVSSTTERPLPAQGVSTESIIDKLDRVQSELSSGVLSGKYPIISQMDSSTPATTTTTGTGKFVPNIRKFQPRTTTAPSTTSSGSKAGLKVQRLHEMEEMDELASLLPVGFKPKPSYKNRKITTTTEAPAPDQLKKPERNSSRSFKNGAVAAQDVALAGLLPKGYRPPKTTTTTTTHAPKSSGGLESLFSEVKFDDQLAALLPKDYPLNATTSKPAISQVDDISKFLPAGFSTSTTIRTTTTHRSPAVAVPFDDLSKFLPPGYKPPSKEEVSEEPKVTKVVDISSFLPPGFKLNETSKPNIPVVASDNDDLLASLLPPGYKSKPVHPASTTSTTSKPKVSSLPTSTEAPANESTPAAAGGSGLKVVFPKGVHKRLGAHRLTTPHTPHESGDGPTSSPAVVIKKGPPTRVTTEFTGWPTPPTTPLSIDKLNAQTINFEDLLTAAGSSTTTSTTTTTTSTTTTTTPRPTKPGHCTADCDLEATIRIIEGVAWKPELLDHNTLEWKNLAHELEAQLNEVYSNAAQLSKWYKKVRIDSFSQGSVLVDYYVELANITDDVNTLEIKQLFHDALTKPATPVLPDKDAQENETDNEAGPQEEQLVKASYQMGKFIIDPAATEFSVIAKNLHSNVELPEDDLPIPQWAIVVIVIGVGSLVFVVIFGVTVLLNRQKRAKKTPIPLTNDMLNELKVNHMGGADNYGVDDFYNIDDPWNDTKQPIKPKRFTNSMHGSNSSNIYDSWRSTRHPHSSGDYFYDQQPTYSQKGDSLKRPQLQQHHHHHHQQQQQQPYAGHQQQGYGHAAYPDAFADAHQMYSYNNHASRTRYARDYDPDF